MCTCDINEDSGLLVDMGEGAWGQCTCTAAAGRGGRWALAVAALICFAYRPGE